MLIIFILFLVLFNIFQFSKIRSYKTITKTSDNEFGIQLELICHGIETIEEACRIYNEYSEELCEVYKNKYRKTQRKEGKLIIQVQ